MLSAVVLTKNEQDRIKACLESVNWADEIIILDNGSADKTLEIANKYTDKIYIYKGLDFASLRNKGMEKASGEWVLYVDSDERVLNNLRKEIEEYITSDRFSALAISRRNIIFGQEIKYKSFWPDWVIRLLKKADFDRWVGEIHEYPKFRGKLGYSKSSFLHLTHRDLDQIILKSLDWSKIDAKLKFEAGHPTMSGWRFLRIFITEILKQGIIKRGFFNGSVGIMDSLLQAFSMYMTYVRLWQLQQPKSVEEIYNDIDKKIMEDGFKF